MDRPIKKEINGIDVYYIKSTKFKTITWSFIFLHDEGTELINEYYFLSNILVDNMRKYPTFVKKYRYLFSLYGLDAFSSVTTIEKNIVNQFVITYPNEIYINNEDSLSEKAFIFLNEIITNPKLRQGKLTKKVLKDSLDEAKQSFKILKSDKDMYSYYRFSKVFYQDKLDLQFNFPENERLDEVTQDTLTSTYFDLLDKNRVSLFVTGNFDTEYMDKIIKKHLSNKIVSQDIKIKKREFYYEKGHSSKIVRETDKFVRQARIYLGFGTNIKYMSKKHAALGVFNDIFGGFDQSKLFMDIREKSKLAYYVYSQYLPEEQLIVVPVITDFQNEKKVIDKVKQALKEIQSGNFSDALFSQAKRNAETSLYSIYDSQPVYLMQHIKAYLSKNEKYDLKKRIEEYRNITREDIIEVSKSLVLDTVYTLSKGDD